MTSHRFMAFCLGLTVLTGAVAKAADTVDGDLAYARADYATAADLWKSAASAGDASAMVGVATLYDTGHGVEQDFSNALEWYRRAAQAGNVSAMFSVAAMYDNGRGAAVDRPEAVRWYGQAAERGNGRAAYALGLIYRDGDGVPRSRPRAIRFFRMAAANGIDAARPSLAALGIGSVAIPVPARPAASVPVRTRIEQQTATLAQFEKAALSRSELAGPAKATAAVIPILDQRARNGSSLAQYEIAYAYERGLGVRADPVQSYINYLKAATSENTSVHAAALKGAAQVGNALTPEQHAAAREALLGGS